MIDRAVNLYAVSLVEIVDNSTGTTYQSTIANMLEHGQVQTRYRGFSQIALHLRYWTINGQPPAAKLEPEPAEPGPVQATLFEEIGQ